MRSLPELSCLHCRILGTAVLWLGMSLRAADSIPATNSPPPDWLTKPVSLQDCLNTALEQNSAVKRSRKTLEATEGVVLQTRAVAIPKLQATGNYGWRDQGGIEKFPIELPAWPDGTQISSIKFGEQQWALGVRLVQSVYEGGRIRSSLRTARLTRETALARHQALLADTLTEVRTAYYRTRMVERQIDVQRASVDLLREELRDTQRRFEAGTVPRFNVLRAEVELANAQPRLIRAENQFLIAKNNLANLLGYDLPRDVWVDVPLHLSDELTAEPFEVELPAAIARATERRPELQAARKAENLRHEGIASAKSGYLPSVEVYAGYGAHSPNYTDDIGRAISGWEAGAQMRWSLFDGLYTRGRVVEARSLYDQATLDTDDLRRRIELEVRTAYSTFIEARKVLESQEKVVEQAAEAHRLAAARSEAGTGTQLDVLSAQTALTEARTVRIQALGEFNVARALLERAIGLEITEATAAR